MQIGELITKEDLRAFRIELLNEIKAIVEKRSVEASIKLEDYIKSREVKKILGNCSSILQNLRVKGMLKPVRIGGTWYYSRLEVEALFNSKKER